MLNLANEEKRISGEGHDSALSLAEERFYNLFWGAPISLWLEDVSDVKKFIDGLKSKGVKDFRAYFNEHPKDIILCADLVRILDVNKVTLDLYKAKTKHEFFEGLREVFCEESIKGFIEQLVAVAEGRTEFEVKAINQTMGGEKIDVLMYWILIPAYEKTLAKELIAIFDITNNKMSKEDLENAKNVYRSIVKNLP